MKVRILLWTLLCLPGWAAAQNEAHMQRMMEQAREAQMCMEKIDRAQLQALADKAQAFEAQIKKLCAEGKRTEAQSQGIKFSQEMSHSPVAQEMRRCSEMMAGVMAGFGGMAHAGVPTVEEMESQHICDTF
ncbi:MAG: hypothetical protein R3E62_08565 [Pseudomonadales bacterium]|jgi:hypothetical protein